MKLRGLIARHVQCQRELEMAGTENPKDAVITRAEAKKAKANLYAHIRDLEMRLQLSTPAAEKPNHPQPGALLPCPFCGRDAVTCAPDQQHPLVSIGCYECGMVCETQWLPEADAIAAWNRRASSVEGQADSDRLDWLERHCVNVADGTASQLYFGTYGTAPLRDAIDAARATQPKESES